MPIDRFTAFGLAVALLGWLLLVADVALSPMLVQAGSLAAVAALRSDVFSIAETTIVSGFALAIIGVLRAGFGALHRFFDTVLERASAPRTSPAAAHPPQSYDVPPVELTPEPAPMDRPAPAPARAHNYVILANGAVEVETLLGTRVFASLDEARDFIR